MNNIDRIEIFKDTLKTEYTHDSIVYTDNIKAGKPPMIIWSENFIDDALSLKNKPIAMLNFADPYLPGGLVWSGVKTQEEDLCRCTNLYHSLTQEKALELFYNYNKSIGKTSNRIIYSPNVLIIKDSNYNNVTPKECDIITCSAPTEREDLTDKEIKIRMRNIILVGCEHNVEVLILGRWGCGAFGNDWNRFKRLWEEVISEIKQL